MPICWCQLNHDQEMFSWFTDGKRFCQSSPACYHTHPWKAKSPTVTMYSWSFDSSIIANTFYWINYTWDVSAHKHTQSRQQALLLARGAEFLCAIPCTQSTITIALREASTHCPETLLFHKLIQSFGLPTSCVNINQIHLELQSAPDQHEILTK